MPWLSLASRALSTFDGLPSPDPCQLRLRVPWKHRRQLRALTSEINLQLSYREADRYRRQIAEREVARSEAGNPNVEIRAESARQPRAPGGANPKQFSKE
jgi:hypothetical protein